MSEKAQNYAQRETVLHRLAQIIVDADCKPYGAAEAILAAGWREHPELSDALHIPTAPSTDCLHIFPDGTRCTLSAQAHKSIVGLADVHGYPLDLPEGHEDRLRYTFLAAAIEEGNDA